MSRIKYVNNASKNKKFNNKKKKRDIIINYNNKCEYKIRMLNINFEYE